MCGFRQLLPRPGVHLLNGFSQDHLFSQGEHEVEKRAHNHSAKREKKNWESALKGIEDAARSAENLMPRIIHAVENLATVGEISDAMRKVFGEHKEAVVI